MKSKDSKKPIARAVVTRPRNQQPPVAVATAVPLVSSTEQQYQQQRKGLFPSLLGKTKSSSKNATKLVPFSTKTVMPPVSKITIDEEQSKLSSLSDPEGILYQLDPRNAKMPLTTTAPAYRQGKSNSLIIPKATLHKPAAAAEKSNAADSNATASERNYYSGGGNKESVKAHTYTAAHKKVMELNNGMRLSAPSPITLDRVVIQQRQEQAKKKLQKIAAESKQGDAAATTTDNGGTSTNRPVAHAVAHAIPFAASQAQLVAKQQAMADAVKTAVVDLKEKNVAVAVEAPTTQAGTEAEGCIKKTQTKQAADQMTATPTESAKKEEKSKKIPFDKVRALLNRMGTNGTASRTSTLPSVVTSSQQAQAAATMTTNSSKGIPATASLSFAELKHVPTQESTYRTSIAHMYSQVTDQTTRDPSPAHGIYPRVAFPPIQSPPRLSKKAAKKDDNRSPLSPGDQQQHRVPVDAPDIVPADQLRPDADGATLEDTDWVVEESVSMLAESVNATSDSTSSSRLHRFAKQSPVPPRPMKRVDEREDESTSRGGRDDDVDSYAMSNPLDNLSIGSSHESYLLDENNLPDPSPRCQVKRDPQESQLPELKQPPEHVDTEETGMPEVIDVMTPRAGESPVGMVHSSNPFDDDMYGRQVQGNGQMRIEDKAKDVSKDITESSKKAVSRHILFDNSSANESESDGAAARFREQSNGGNVGTPVVSKASGEKGIRTKDVLMDVSTKHESVIPIETTRLVQEPSGSSANLVNDKRRHERCSTREHNGPKPRYTISKMTIPVAIDNDKSHNYRVDVPAAQGPHALVVRPPRTKLQVETADFQEESGIPLPAVDSSAMMAALEMSLSPNSNIKASKKKKKGKSPRKVKRQPPNSPLTESPRFTNSPRVGAAKSLKDSLSKKAEKLAKGHQSFRQDAAVKQNVADAFEDRGAENVIADEDQQPSLPREIALSADDPVSDLDQSLRHFPMREINAHGSLDVSALDPTRDDGTISSKEDFDRFARSLETPDKYAPLMTPLPPLHPHERKRIVRISTPVASGKALADSLSEEKVTWSVDDVGSEDTGQVAVEVMLNACNQMPLGEMLVSEMNKPWGSKEFPNDAEKILKASLIDQFHDLSRARDKTPSSALAKDTPKVTNRTTRPSTYFFSDDSASPSRCSDRHSDLVARQSHDSDDEFANMLRADSEKARMQKDSPKSPDPVGRDAASVIMRTESSESLADANFMIVRKTSSHAFVNENGDRYHVAEVADDGSANEVAPTDDLETHTLQTELSQNFNNKDDNTERQSRISGVSSVVSTPTRPELQGIDPDRQQQIDKQATTRVTQYHESERGITDRKYQGSTFSMSLPDNQSQAESSLYRSLDLAAKSDDSFDDEATDKYATPVEIAKHHPADQSNQIHHLTGESLGCDGKSAFVSNLLAFGHNFLGLSPTVQGELAGKIEALSPKSKSILEKSIEKAKSEETSKRSKDGSHATLEESSRDREDEQPKSEVCLQESYSATSSKLDSSTLSSKEVTIATNYSRPVENLDAIEEEGKHFESLTPLSNVIDLTDFASFDDADSSSESVGVWYFEGAEASKVVHGTKLDEVFDFAADTVTLRSQQEPEVCVGQNNDEALDPLIVVRGKDVELSSSTIVQGLDVNAGSICSESPSQLGLPNQDYSSFDTLKIRNTRSHLRSCEASNFSPALSMISESNDRYAVDDIMGDKTSELCLSKDKAEDDEISEPSVDLTAENREISQMTHGVDVSGAALEADVTVASTDLTAFEVQAKIVDADSVQIEIEHNSQSARVLPNSWEADVSVDSTDLTTFEVQADALDGESGQIEIIPTSSQDVAHALDDTGRIPDIAVISEPLQNQEMDKASTVTPVENEPNDHTSDISFEVDLSRSPRGSNTKYISGLQHKQIVPIAAPSDSQSPTVQSRSSTFDEDSECGDELEHVVIEPPIRLSEKFGKSFDSGNPTPKVKLNHPAVSLLRESFMREVGKEMNMPTTGEKLASESAWQRNRTSLSLNPQETEAGSRTTVEYAPIGLFASMISRIPKGKQNTSYTAESGDNDTSRRGNKTEISKTGNDLLDFLCDNAETMICGQTTDIIETRGYSSFGYNTKAGEDFHADDDDEEMDAKSESVVMRRQVHGANSKQAVDNYSEAPKYGTQQRHQCLSYDDSEYSLGADEAPLMHVKIKSKEMSGGESGRFDPLEGVYEELGEIYKEVQSRQQAELREKSDMMREDHDPCGDDNSTPPTVYIGAMGPRPEDVFSRHQKSHYHTDPHVQGARHTEKDAGRSIASSFDTGSQAGPANANYPEAPTHNHEKRFWGKHRAPVPEDASRFQGLDNDSLQQSRGEILHRMEAYLKSVQSTDAMSSFDPCQNQSGFKKSIFGPCPEDRLPLRRMTGAPVVQGHEPEHWSCITNVVEGRAITVSTALPTEIASEKPRLYGAYESVEPIVVATGRFVDCSVQPEPSKVTTVGGGNNLYRTLPVVAGSVVAKILPDILKDGKVPLSYSLSECESEPGVKSDIRKWIGDAEQELHSTRARSPSSRVCHTQSASVLPSKTDESVDHLSDSSQSGLASRVNQILDSVTSPDNFEPGRSDSSMKDDLKREKIVLSGSLVVRGRDVTAFSSDMMVVQGVEPNAPSSAPVEVATVSVGIDAIIVDESAKEAETNVEVTREEYDVVESNGEASLDEPKLENPPADPPGRLKAMSLVSATSDERSLSLVVSDDDATGLGTKEDRSNEDVSLIRTLSDGSTSLPAREYSKADDMAQQETFQTFTEKQIDDEDRISSAWNRLFCGGDGPSEMMPRFHMASTDSLQHQRHDDVNNIWNGSTLVINSFQETARAVAPQLSPCGSSCPPSGLVTNDDLERRLLVHEETMRRRLAGTTRSVFTDNETISRSEGMSADSLSRSLNDYRESRLAREGTSSKCSGSQEKSASRTRKQLYINETMINRPESKHSHSRAPEASGDGKTAWDPSTIESGSRRTTAVPKEIAVNSDMRGLNTHGVPLEIQVVDGDNLLKKTSSSTAMSAKRSTVHYHGDDYSSAKGSVQYVARFGSVSGEKDLGMPPKHGIASEASFQSEDPTRSPRSNNYSQRSRESQSNINLILDDEDSQGNSDNESSLLLALTRSDGEIAAEAPKEVMSPTNHALRTLTEKTSFMSRVETARALALSPRSENDKSSVSRMGLDSNEPFPNTIAVASPRKEFTRSPRLQTVLDRLRERRKQSSLSGDDERRSFGNDVDSHVDVDDLFSRYDNIVKHMVVLDDDRLMRAQGKQMHSYDTTSKADTSRLLSRMSPSMNSDHSKDMDHSESAIIDVTELMEPAHMHRTSRRARKEDTSERRRSSSINVTRDKPRQSIVRRASSFGSENSTPSQKARDLRKQLDQALKTSAKIRNTQERLGAELTTFKTRIQLQRDLSPAASRASSRSRSQRELENASAIMQNSASSSGRSPSLSDTNRSLMLNAPVLSDRTVVSGEQVSHHSFSRNSIPTEVSRSGASKRSVVSTTAPSVRELASGDEPSFSFNMAAEEFDLLVSEKVFDDTDLHRPESLVTDDATRQPTASAPSPRTRIIVPSSPVSTSQNLTNSASIAVIGQPFDDDSGSVTSKNSHQSRNSAKNPINLIASKSLVMSEATSVKATSPANRQASQSIVMSEATSVKATSPANRQPSPRTSLAAAGTSPDTLNIAIVDVDVDTSDDDDSKNHNKDDIHQATSSNSYSSEDEVKMMHLQSILHGLRNAEERKNQSTTD